MSITLAENYVLDKRQLLHGLRVLVIEDQAIIRLATVEALEHEGAEVDDVDAIAAALNALETFSYDLILSNTVIQGKDGYEFIQTWRNREREKEISLIPAIVVSQEPTEQLERRALSAGFQAYLSKPVDCDIVIATIANLLQLNT